MATIPDMTVKIRREWDEHPLTFAQAMFLLLLGLYALNRGITWWWLVLPFAAQLLGFVLARIFGPVCEMIGYELSDRFVRRRM